MIYLFLQIVSCAFMTGLIWTIQVLHYPAFTFVQGAQFKRFHLNHSRNITWIVFPVMLLELATAIFLLKNSSHEIILQINAVLLIFIWFATVILSVPIHQNLSQGQDLIKIEQLIATNWIRTILWSLRLVLLVIYFFQELKVYNVDIF